MTKQKQYEMNKPIEINLSSRTLEMLLKYAKDMIEATAGAWTEPWRANQKADALRTLAQAEADQLIIVSKGQSRAIETILGITTGENKTVELTTSTGNHSITSQGQKRFSNIRKTLIRTARQLEEVEVEQHQPDPDWSASFALSVQDVSSEKLQDWWSKILTGEIQNPGKTSLRTLSVLKDMSQQDALTFEETANYVIGGAFLFSRDGFSSDKDESGTTINYGKIMLMQECGLITGSLTSNLPLTLGRHMDVFHYHSTLLGIEQGLGAKDGLQIPVVVLTTAGRELYQIMSPETQVQYLTAFATFLHYKHHNLYRLEGFKTLTDGTHHYDNKIRIMYA